MDRKHLRKGFSLIELLIVVAIILIIAAVAIPKMNNQLMQAREMAAIREIGTIHQGQTQYYSQFGHFAQSLAELGPPASGPAGPAAADLIPASLTRTGKKSGHIFTVSLTPTGYAITVTPEQFGGTGSRNFYSDQTLVIHESRTTEPATALSPELGSNIASAPAQ